MLEELLAEIRLGGPLQPAVLAARLHTSVFMVQAMLADLERRGLLRQVERDCTDSCGGCALTDSCGAHGKTNGLLWELNVPG